MIKLRETKINELDIIYKIGIQEHSKPFLSTKTTTDYKQEFLDNKTTYLCIVNESDTILGYIILLKKENKNSIQLKRILISKKSLGIGQEALTALEKYCIDTMNIKHIWLDVYEDNYKAIHIYEKFNYLLFKVNIQDNRKILYYDKSL